MKYILVIALVLIGTIASAFTNGEFDNFRRELSIQTEQWKSSEQHRQTKMSRDVRDYEVGDTRTFWRWNLSIMPPSWIQTDATCRAVGEHCYLFVADDQWNSNMDQDDVDTIMPYLEEETLNSDQYGAIQMDAELFGPIPDELDNDPKLIVFYSALGQFQGSMFDGYFSPYNQVTEQEAQQMSPAGHSNECEMIYMTCSPLDPVEMIRISVLAHELQHLIHWGGDPNEETWVDEGCAELAMVWFGLPDPITGFNTNPDNSLIEWEQEFADYVKVMLFFTYLAEHYDDGTLIQDIVSNPTNGINGIEDVMDAHEVGMFFEDLFHDWTIANFINDLHPYEGLYGYELLDLPLFHAQNLHTSLPDDGSGTVSPWAAEYSKIVTGETPLTFEVSVNNPVAIAEVRLGNDPAGTLVLMHYCDDELTFTSHATSENYSSVILVFSNQSHHSVTYEYEVDEQVSVDDDLTEAPIRLSIAPNPYSGEFLKLSIPTQKPVPVSIYNVRGQMVREIQTDAQGHAVWDGRDTRDRKVGEGVYFVRAESSVGPVTRKITVLR